MEAPPDEYHDPEAEITRQLPVISSQRDSLAAVMLTRWLRLAVAHGPAGLTVARHRGQERWELHWRAPDHRAHTVVAPTLAELFVHLLAALPEGERRHWTSGAPPLPSR
jgi:hypothetical protein